nr:claudin-18 [Meriones unguiculatus]
MATTTCQAVGLLLSLLGLAGCIAATGMDMWSTQDLYDNPVTSVFQYEGLWRSCVQQSSGFTECRPYFTILGLPEREAPPSSEHCWYTFGAALFVGWVAGGLTLIGGVMMCIACRGLTPDDSNFKAVSYHASGQNVAYKHGGFKASTGFGSNTRNKKIYDGGARTEDDEQPHPTKYDYV